MELVGRETELASVDLAVQEVRAGEPRALGLFGEPGIGKSALLRAAKASALDAGMLVLEGRAAEHERSVPFGPVVDALDDHVATPRRVGRAGPRGGAAGHRDRRDARAAGAPVPPSASAIAVNAARADRYAARAGGVHASTPVAAADERCYRR